MERILELLNNYMNNAKIKLDELDKNIQYKNKIFDLFKYINYYVHIIFPPVFLLYTPYPQFHISDQ